MYRREFLKISAAVPIGPALFMQHNNANAFIPLLIRALIGAAGGTAVRSAYAGRIASVERIAATTGRARPTQLTVVNSASLHLLSPRVHLSNKTNVYQDATTIQITEYNMQDGGSRQATIPSWQVPPYYDQMVMYPMQGWNYGPGRDYVREVLSVDRCGCTTRFEPELVMCT
jgi:hypothetical protein